VLRRLSAAACGSGGRDIAAASSWEGSSGAASGGGASSGGSFAASTLSSSAATAADTDGDPEWPHPNNVSVSSFGGMRPTAWLSQNRVGFKHVSTVVPACPRCGFRGHSVAAACAVPRCARCGGFGHLPTECSIACRSCRIAGGPRADPRAPGQATDCSARNAHEVSECPFPTCRCCGRVGHYTAECPGPATDPPPPRAPAALAPAGPPAWQQAGASVRAVAASGGGAAGAARSGSPAAAAGAQGPAGVQPHAPEELSQVAAQVEALMDLLFVRIPEVAVELTGGAASALAAHLPCSGSGWAGPVRCACLLLAGRRSASCWHSLTWRVPCTQTPVSRVPHTHKLIKGMPHTDLEAPAEKHQAQASSMCL
jgi:hypothetical protein